MLRATSLRLALATTRACSTTAPPPPVDEEIYHRLASCTLEGVQEVYEDMADDEPELAMEVEYSVKNAPAILNSAR